MWQLTLKYYVFLWLLMCASDDSSWNDAIKPICWSQQWKRQFLAWCVINMIIDHSRRNEKQTFLTYKYGIVVFKSCIGVIQQVLSYGWWQNEVIKDRSTKFFASLTSTNWQLGIQPNRHWTFLQFSKADIYFTVSLHYLEKWHHFISSKTFKHLCALGLGLGLAEIRFWSNVFLSKCSRTIFYTIFFRVGSVCVIVFRLCLNR